MYGSWASRVRLTEARRYFVPPLAVCAFVSTSISVVSCVWLLQPVKPFSKSEWKITAGSASMPLSPGYLRLRLWLASAVFASVGGGFVASRASAPLASDAGESDPLPSDWLASEA